MTFRMPPEWAPQDWLWIGFPHDAKEWPDTLPRAQEQIAAFANAIAESGQEVRLLVMDGANEARARQLVPGSVVLESVPMATSGWAIPVLSCCAMRMASVVRSASASTAGAANI